MNSGAHTDTPTHTHTHTQEIEMRTGGVWLLLQGTWKAERQESGCENSVVGDISNRQDCEEIECWHIGNVA